MPERSGAIRDPFGHRWNIGHALETVSPEEMRRTSGGAMLAVPGCVLRR
jgi:PhnB protein